MLRRERALDRAACAGSWEDVLAESEIGTKKALMEESWVVESLVTAVL